MLSTSEGWWFRKINPPLILIVLFHATVLLPFRFTTAMQERDSYRMLLGLLDMVSRNIPFESSLLYNRELSFGYYGLIYSLTAVVGSSPATVIHVMNLLSILSAVGLVIPFYLIVLRLFGEQTPLQPRSSWELYLSGGMLPCMGIR